LACRWLGRRQHADAPPTWTLAPATSVAVTSSATNGSAIPVKGSFGNLVPNVPVSFKAPSNGAGGTFTAVGGSSTAVTVMTNPLGVASAPTFTANSLAGSYQVMAAVNALKTSFQLTNTVIPTSITATAGNKQSTTVGTAFATALQATVKDASGNPVSGISVIFTAPSTGSGGTFSKGATSMTVTTNASGVASAGFTANTTAGSYSVKAAVSGVTAVAIFNLINNAGAPAHITAASGTPQNTTVGTTFTTALQVTVEDEFGNAVEGAKVTFQAPRHGAGGTFGKRATSITVATNAAGVASVKFTANKIAGNYSVQAMTPGVFTAVSFSLTNTPGTPAKVEMAGGNKQHALSGIAFAKPLAVAVIDKYGNAISGVSVTFAAPSSSATGTFGNGLHLITVVTTSSGLAVAPTFTANRIKGKYKVKASFVYKGISLSTSFKLMNS